jgi:1-acyl-sn-glycerol-3-phosphate acyltransferase
VNEPYLTPFRNRLARVILRPLFRGLFHILGKVEITGRENIPPQGAYLIAINHISIYEAPLVVAFWPVAPEVAGASDIWERPGQSMLVRLYSGIPVHRGQYDRRLIDYSLAALQSGHPLLIAPEGGRSHTPGMQRAHSGVAYFMSKAGVPVLPVGIVGSTEDFFSNGIRGKRPRIGMRIGKPFDLEPVVGKGAVRREKWQQNADLVMTQIAALLPPDYRGVYADFAHLIA